MSANKIYEPAFIGGVMKGVEVIIQNNSQDTVNTEYTNGVYYSYNGKDFQLLSLGGMSIESGKTLIKSVELKQQLIPSSDIKILIDIGGLVNCNVDVYIAWSVE